MRTSGASESYSEEMPDNMREATWNNHKPTVIEMVNDEGKFSLQGKSVLLVRRIEREGEEPFYYGLMVTFIDTLRGGCFDVLPVEVDCIDGTWFYTKNHEVDSEIVPKMVGGMDVWTFAQGIAMFNVRPPYSKDKHPSTTVFIPPSVDEREQEEGLGSLFR